MLIVKNKAKTTHLTLHPQIDFKASQSVILENTPKDLIPTLDQQYQENFLNVSIQDKIQALKNRYVQYEKMMKKHLQSSHGLAYSRVHFNSLTSESQVLVIGYMRAIEEDGKIKSDSFLLDCLNPNDGSYCVNCFIDVDQVELIGFQFKGI